jgi:tyrosine-specific transport protein
MNTSSFIQYVFSICSAALLLAGNMIGSGLLALPVCVGIAGTSAALFGLILVWLMMLFTALIIAYHMTRSKTSYADIPSFFSRVLGSKFKWVAIIANLIMLYGLLVAYLSGTASILLNTFQISLSSGAMVCVVFLGMTLLNVFGLQVVRYGTTLFMIVLAVSFFYLVGKTSLYIDTANFIHSKWIFLAVAFPILVNAYNCHNLIPTVCRLLNFNIKLVYTAIFIGLSIGFVVNTAWTMVVIGVLPLDKLLHSFTHNFAATISLSHQIKSDVYMMMSVLFALLAIITSYVTVGAAACNFVRDLRSKYLSIQSRYFDLLLAFVPPFFLTLFFPNVFLSVQGIIGSFGIGILFGLMPAYVFFKTSVSVWTKSLGLTAVLFFTMIIILLVLFHFYWLRAGLAG